jgi:DNA-directed RNA polymerase specialized sigma24 family protein
MATPLKNRPEEGERDHALTSGRRAEEGGARRTFLERSTLEILATARRWCRRYCAGEEPCCLRSAPRSQLWERFVASGCDEISHRYAFLSERLAQGVEGYGGGTPPYGGTTNGSRGERLVQGVKGYAGDGPSREWVRNFLRSPRLYDDYVAEACGQEWVSRILKDAPDRLKKVFRLDQRGWEVDRMAAHLRCSPEEVQADLEEIEGRLRAAGPEDYWYWQGYRTIQTVRLGEGEDEEDGEEVVAEEEISSLEADVPTKLLAKRIVEAMQVALAGLAEGEAALLWKKLTKGRPAREVAVDLHVTPRRVDWLLTRSLTHLLVLLREALSPWGEVTAEVATLKWILEEYGAVVFPVDLRTKFS